MKIPNRKPDFYIKGINIWELSDHFVASIDLKDGYELTFAASGLDINEFIKEANDAFLRKFIETYATLPTPKEDSS